MRRDALLALALTVVVAGLWCLAYGRTSRGAWTTPVRYYGDAWLVLATLKTAQDGHVVPFSPLYVPELGAPFEANWNSSRNLASRW